MMTVEKPCMYNGASSSNDPDLTKDNHMVNSEITENLNSIDSDSMNHPQQPDVDDNRLNKISEEKEINLEAILDIPVDENAKLI